jgi:HlyD family secretion protein
VQIGKWVWIGVGLFVVVTAVWVSLRADPLVVETAVARTDTLTVALTEEGRTRVHDRYIVAAPVTGRLSRIVLEAGDSVRAGDVVARIAPPPTDLRTAGSARADLSVAEARVREASAEVETLRRLREQTAREYERRVPLFEMGAISREALERARSEAETAETRLLRAEATLVAAESAVEAARARLIGVDPAAGSADEAVRSPVTGIVMRVHEESERVVPAGAPIVSVSGPEGLEFVVDLLTEEAVRVSPGDEARITGWGGDAVIAGRVRYVEPAAFTEVSALGVEEQRVNVVGRLVDPPPGLGAGFRLDVSIVTWFGEGVLVVPASAVFQRPSGWQLFVVESGRARSRAVELGHRGADRVEIVSGLDPGDEVILYPSDAVEEGARVRPSSAGS